MKKITILCLMFLIISGCSPKEEKIQINTENIKTTTETLDIIEYGTEITLTIENAGTKIIDINEIEAELYDSSSKKIATIKKKLKTQIKDKQTKKIKLSSKNKYPATAEIKYILYS